MSDLQQRPSNVRYLIVAAATLMAFLLYLDRFCVSFAVDYIRQDLDLTQSDMKWFLNSFFFSYALAQVPSGWLSNRYGARIMLVIYILAWSFFTGYIGASYSFVMLISTRLMCGLGQAGAYPTAASVVKRWMPITARGTASSFVANGGRIGGALAPVLTAYLIVMFVPLGTPPELKPGDILDAQKMSERLYDKSDEMAQSVVAKLPSPLPADSSALTDEQLVELINPLLDEPNLYDESTMLKIKLPREATKTLQVYLVADQVMAAEKLRRFNRFILEGVFPNAIRKFYGQGWRPILWIYGGAGIFVAAIFWFVFRNRPEEHPMSNEAEHKLILAGQENTVLAAGQSLDGAPMKAMLTSGNLWLNCIGQWGTNVGWVFLVMWLSRYLMQMHQVPILQRGEMLFIVLLVGMAGMFCGGTLSDVIARRVGIKWGRRIPVASSRLLAVSAYLTAIWLSTLPEDHSLYNPWSFVAVFSVVAFSTDFGSAPNWAFMQDVGGRHVGSVLGWGNMWGNLGAFFAPLIYDYFLGETPGKSEWIKMFAVCAAAFAVSGLCWLKIDATKPVVPNDQNQADA